MRVLLITALCLFAADAPNPAVDGQSLDGWSGLTKHWKAAEGAIVGTSDGSIKFNTFLCTQKKFKNFELSVQVKLKGGVGNSGIQIRSEVLDKEKWTVKGPQVDIADKYWGSLYGEQFGGMMKQADFPKLKPHLKPDDFNDLFIRVVGKKVTIKVNDVVTVDQEFEKLPTEGIIALQLHQGPAMEVTFKGMKIKEIK
jgi:hypothetical protein